MKKDKTSRFLLVYLTTAAVETNLCSLQLAESEPPKVKGVHAE